MDFPKSKPVRILSIVYGLVAVAGIYIATMGHIHELEPLPLINETGNKLETVEQAKYIMELAQKQQQDHLILNMFYKGWLLKSEYRSLTSYKKPMFDGDSFERRLISFNNTVKQIFHTILFI